jgi:hypothetical protein
LGNDIEARELEVDATAGEIVEKWHLGLGRRRTPNGNMGTTGAEKHFTFRSKRRHKPAVMLSGSSMIVIIHVYHRPSNTLILQELQATLVNVLGVMLTVEKVRKQRKHYAVTIPCLARRGKQASERNE